MSVDMTIVCLYSSTDALNAEIIQHVQGINPECQSEGCQGLDVRGWHQCCSDMS